MAFVLPQLPYDKKALEPFISENTMNFHYGKHHQTYLDNLNKLVQGTDNENVSLEDLIRIAAGKKDMHGIFKNAAQVWNHTFFWNCMKPNGGGVATGKIADMINATFGNYENFAKEFKQAALDQFGSGWAWLVQDNDTIKIVKTSNSDLPMAHKQKALLTCDVWEHAYYLDYQNRRGDFVQAFLDKLINWDFVNSNLS